MFFNLLALKTTHSIHPNRVVVTVQHSFKSVWPVQFIVHHINSVSVQKEEYSTMVDFNSRSTTIVTMKSNLVVAAVAAPTRARGIRRSWLAIGMFSTCLVGITPTTVIPNNLSLPRTEDQVSNKPISFWAQSKEARAAIRRERRRRIAKVRELKELNNSQEVHSMFEESFELMFREMQFSMSMSPVSLSEFV